MESGWSDKVGDFDSCTPGRAVVCGEKIEQNVCKAFFRGEICRAVIVAKIDPPLAFASEKINNHSHLAGRCKIGVVIVNLHLKMVETSAVREEKLGNEKAAEMGLGRHRTVDPEKKTAI